MNKLYVLLALALMMPFALAVSDNTGAIWTTGSDCGAMQQNVNHYAIGEDVYINGAGFQPGMYPWDITGLPGNASCDPGTVVANGTMLVGDSGEFCMLAYTVANDDCGEYKATVDGKHDNYRVDNMIPEFGVIAALVAIAGAIGIVAYRRH